MSIEQITRKRVERLDVVGDDLAESYQIAFAGKPWNERSRCTNEMCDVVFCPENPGMNCRKCDTTLEVAYDPDTLVSGWRTMVEEDSALMQLTCEENTGRVTCATIARPTCPAELFLRKYNDVPVMQQWIEQALPNQFVWIEDTFANRARSPRGNLRNRAQIIGNIALHYGGLTVVTRTITPQIIAATERDMGGNSTVYVGTDGVGSNSCGFAIVDENPDRRSILVINTEESR